MTPLQKIFFILLNFTGDRNVLNLALWFENEGLDQYLPSLWF